MLRTQVRSVRLPSQLEAHLSLFVRVRLLPADIFVLMVSCSQSLIIMERPSSSVCMPRNVRRRLESVIHRLCCVGTDL
jgi:hypothetical protein